MRFQSKAFNIATTKGETIRPQNRTALHSRQLGGVSELRYVRIALYPIEWGDSLND